MWPCSGVIGNHCVHHIEFMNNTAKLKVVKLFLCLIMFGVAAVQAQLRPGNLTAYKEKEGLPGLEVDHLIADRQGYIWTGTINGLARFDGYQFQRYYFNPNDSSTIHGLIVWSIFEDRKGYVWVGTSPSFLNRYDPATRSFRQYPFMHLFPGKSGIEVNVRNIAQDARGRLYFGVDTYYGDSISHALLYMDEGDSVIHVHPAPKEGPIFNIVRMMRGGDGKIWFLTYNGILRIDQKGVVSRFEGLDAAFGKNEGMWDFAVDSAGHVIEVTNKSRVLDFDPKTGQHREWSKPELGFDQFSSVILDKNQDIWIASSNGLFHFDRRNGELSGFPSTDASNIGRVPFRSLCVDGFGNLWAGSAKDGLFRYEDRNRLRSYVNDKRDPNSLTAAWANNIMEASDGKLWITTGGSPTLSGINILDPVTGSLRPIAYPKIGTRINGVSAIWEPEPGRTWLAVYNGLYEFSPLTLKLAAVHLPGVPDSMFILHHFADSRGGEWLATNRGVYHRAKGWPAFRNYNLHDQSGWNYSSSEVSRIVEGPKNGIWFLTNNGLFLYDHSNGKIARHGFDKARGDIFVTQDVNSLYEDSSGIAWVGTWQGGLSKYDVKAGKIKSFTRNDGLPSNSIQGILPDDRNHSLWLSTFEGMSRLDLETLRFSNYSIEDGIQSQLFADGSQLKTSKGLMVFGGANGVTIFHPDSISRTSIPPKVFLTDLKLFNKVVLPGKGSVLSKPINETDSVVLAHDQNNITLEFIAIHYSNPTQNRYSYKLENYDADWRDVGNQRAAFYPNLPPGKYVFHVKAANDKGVWNEKGATLHITVLPPWWRTIWAYLLYALVFGLLAFALDRYLRSRILQREREKNHAREMEQAKEIQKAYLKLEETHESLKTTQKQLVQSEKMASLGELTAGIAHEIQNPLNFVNNFAEINRELIDEVKSQNEKIKKGEEKGLDEELLKDLDQNMGKIAFHGKRADAIVKSMLQHSRASTGEKEPTDLNALADEYLKLAYHGLRAKDKDFNVTLETDFDPNLGKVDVVPQDIGRVLLNLYNNAFQAVMERKKSGEVDYEPKVRVSVSSQQSAVSNSESGVRNPEFVTLRVTDNGLGIPDAIRAKIFQPFFTTKPTGQGTGLGLSLSYDIIKSHGGELKLEETDGGGTKFVVQLPST
jgi:signal transduction histidine kinase/ligand-binding sensor domain-containing protein